jgi:hypothetical protein
MGECFDCSYKEEVIITDTRILLLTVINQSNFRLKEYCERLMFYNPSDYGRKAEEVLWRKVFYEIIQLMKHNRKVLYKIMLGSRLSCFMFLWIQF